MNALTTRALSLTRMVILTLAPFLPTAALPATNATANSDWISIGVPSNIFLGTAGVFYMTGTDMGSCTSTTPTYFRVNTSANHWKELYSLFLYSHA
jgi:hypothetical protein